ncbi:hypothetical protein IEQ34_020253 [Dendrobium chrysotoxum]|uniref:Uncharacterized protein n=1 Tax=Dendrobium chrysotoxum TaxID=161865 RepID=A0AAV7G001_DENCH|nr:hypothetical protein IEQ34_020253 [Dendrobium chrysotoxum]
MYKSKRYVSYMSKESIQASNFLLMPVSKAWIFFDSYHNLTHRTVLLDVVTIILPRVVNWKEQLDWQLEMPKYRAEPTYAILCGTIK